MAGTIGADARWLPALGRTIVHHGIPDGVPFASAPSAGWHNVPVLAELVLGAANGAFGERGLLLAQVAAVAAGLTILASDMRRAGADDAGASLVLALIVIGALPALLVVRAQLFSLLLFPLLALLLRSESRTPSKKVWLIVPLLALWSNLHGAVLVGLVVATAYLVLDRARRQPLVAAGVLAASTLAICATPALENTPDYYLGVLHNEAARRGVGLWAPLTISSGFDLVLLAAAVILLALALRARPALWEVIAFAALAVLSVRTARSGVWLLFFAGPPAARAVALRTERRLRTAAVVFAFAAALIVYGVARGPLSTGAGSRLIGETLRSARGTPIVAEGVLAEQVALGGGRVWMSNPLDAFSRQDQRIYLDWIDGRPGGVQALSHATRAVLVLRDGDAAKLVAPLDKFRQVAADDHAVLYVRRFG